MSFLVYKTRWKEGRESEGAVLISAGKPKAGLSRRL